MRKVLVKLADKFDQEGKYDLASVVDGVILSTAARNKAPLKDLDEDVKKDLLKFLHTVQKNMKNSMTALDEFFRRLRYFDIGDTVREMGLDKALKEMEKTHDCIDNAGRSMYTMAYGRRPSKSDMAQMADDFSIARDEKPNPLSFFESQMSNDADFEERKKEMGEEEVFEIGHKDDDKWKEYVNTEGSEPSGGGEATLWPREPSEALEEDEEPEKPLSDDEYEDFMRNMEEYEEFMGSEDEGEEEVE